MSTFLHRLFMIVLAACALPVAADADANRNLAVTRADSGGERRIALVIGNSTYADAPLKNPANDARSMAAALKALGFEVIDTINASQKEMNRAIAQFGQRLGADTVALFYYAGHGMQVKGKNYLIPVDAQISGESAVRAEGVDVDAVLDQLGASALNIVILDACRNNPFDRSSRGTSGGLASMDAPKGTLIAYATGPGRVAADGRGDNGLYTAELLKVLDEPGLRIEDVFKRVRFNVARLTQDQQIPWETSSLVGDFHFRPGAAPVAAGTAPLEIEAMEDELLVVAATPVYRQPQAGGETTGQLKPGAWQRVTGRLRSPAMYRVQTNGGAAGYVPVAALEVPWYKRIARLYKGEVTSNVNRPPDMVATRFDFLNGQLHGTYTITEPNGKTDGTLRDFKPLGPGKGSLKWQDPYGSGTLHLEFDGALARFQGKWQVDGMPDQGGKWSGTQQ